ncbi:MAG: hypothetical protein J5W83_19185, partial [Candidatus Accumulibacter sp.]|uniref:hypothetical protein n=1 Tax=Accumulibacter sp. TaxID=2053492 RepID=UPI001B141EC6
ARQCLHHSTQRLTATLTAGRGYRQEIRQLPGLLPVDSSEECVGLRQRVVENVGVSVSPADQPLDGIAPRVGLSSV